MPSGGGTRRKRRVSKPPWQEDAREPEEAVCEQDGYWDLPVEQEERVEEVEEERPRLRTPPLKRRRGDAREWPEERRRQQPQSWRKERDSTVVVFENVPAEYTRDMLLELHDSFGLVVSSEADLRLGPSEQVSRAGPMVRSVTVRYPDEETAQEACRALDGQAVATRKGETLVLHTSPPASSLHSASRDLPPVEPRRGGRDSSWPPQRRAGGKGKGKRGGGPDVIYPSAYISDVPVEYKEVTMRKMHDACGLDPSAVMGVKFLPPLDATSETCCCIVRYRDQESANKAVAAIKGRPVQLRSGACKFFGAKIAKPAKWMVDLGRAPAGDNPNARAAIADAPTYNASRKKEFDWCGEGPRCLGRIGMLLYEDLSTGTPFCEACWDRFELEEAEGNAAVESDADDGSAADAVEG